MTGFDEILRVQRMMASKVMAEASMDMKINLLEIIRNLVSGKKSKIQVEQVLYEAHIEGISEADALRMIDDLKRDNLIVEVEPGYIKLL